MNERTHFFIKIYLSHFIQKGWSIPVCVWNVSWRRRQTALTITALLPHSAGLLNRGSWGPKLSVWSWFSLRGHPFSNWNCNSNSNWLQLELKWLKSSVAYGYIIVWHLPASCGRTYLHRIQLRPQVKGIFRHPRPHAPASPFFCLFKQVHLLIDGKVEVQYVTICQLRFIIRT